MLITKFSNFLNVSQQFNFNCSVYYKQVQVLNYSSFHSQKFRHLLFGQKCAVKKLDAPSRVTDDVSMKSLTGFYQSLRSSGLHYFLPLSLIGSQRTFPASNPILSHQHSYYSYNLMLKNDRAVKSSSLQSQQFRCVHSGQVCASVESANLSEDTFFTKTTTLSETDIKEIVDDDPELEKLLKVLILEIDIFRQDGQLVPDKIEKDHWRELLVLKNRSSRLRYLTFLFKNEKRELNKINRKAAKAKEREESTREALESGHIVYGFRGSTIFLRVYDSTMDAYLNKNLINAAMFSQHIVLDCSYDRHMTKMESKNCARQICMLFAENRNHRNPFHIQFCNADPDSHLMQCVNRYFPTMYEPQYPFFVTEKSYLDIYPKEQLVYLTPHCRNDLLEWNHDDVYIIGAMVDKSNPKPLSLAKAKEEGLRMAKLPLERHLIWGSGATKNLTLNQMTSILLDMRDTNDWSKAFKHIPRRKLVTDQELVNEARKENSQVFKKFVKKKQGVNEVLLSDNMIRKMKPRKFDVSSLYDGEK